MADVPVERQVAEDLLAIGTVSMSPDAPFTWASGMLSPIYCDFDQLVDAMRAAGGLGSAGAESIAAWRRGPWRWTEEHRASEVRI